MLRLDPAYPPVWRTPTTLQFGVDAVALLEDPEPWEERVVDELSRGLPEGAVHPLATEAGATAADIRRLLERLAPALRATEAASARAVLIHRPATIDEEDARAVRDAVMADGARVRLVEGDALRPLEGETVILLAAHVVDPRLAAALLRDDVPHLPLVFTGRRATIGPLVRPGETACLMCVEARRRDLDPAWPAIASQLLARRARSVGRALALEAGLLAGRLISESDEAGRSAHSVTVRADSSQRSWQVHPPHEECRCRSLGGTVTAIAPDIRSRLVTRTRTVSARSA